MSLSTPREGEGLLPLLLRSADGRELACSPTACGLMLSVRAFAAEASAASASAVVLPVPAPAAALERVLRFCEGWSVSDERDRIDWAQRFVTEMADEAALLEALRVADVLHVVPLIDLLSTQLMQRFESDEDALRAVIARLRRPLTDAEEAAVWGALAEVRHARRNRPERTTATTMPAPSAPRASPPRKTEAHVDSAEETA